MNIDPWEEMKYVPEPQDHICTGRPKKKWDLRLLQCFRHYSLNIHPKIWGPISIHR